MVKPRKTLTIILCILLMLGGTVLAAAEDEILPVPDWVSERTNSDGSITIVIETPAHMLDFIDYYEYSTDGGLLWEKLSNVYGGEFVVTETGEFSLRYVHNDVTSEAYTVTVVIEKSVAVTSDSTGITMIIPKDSGIPLDITLSAYEIINGVNYTSAQALIGKNKPFMLFSVTVMRNNRVYCLDTELPWLFPIRNLDYRYCRLYHIDENGNMTEIPAEPELNMLYCHTAYTGRFAVVEDKTNSPGDVNGDALVNAADARLALRTAAKLENLNETQFKAADIDSDGKVTSADARRILRAAAGLEKL